MSIKATGLREDLHGYLVENFSGEDAFLKELLIESEEKGFPQISISPEQIRFLQFLCLSINAKYVVEIGTLGGYSGIAIARALPEDGKLITVELEKDRAEFATQKFEQAGLKDKVEVICSDGMDFIKTFAPEYPVDFIFLDADKNNYHKYVLSLESKLKVGGIIAADNAFAFGYVLDSAPERNPEDVKSIKSFNQFMNNHRNFLTTLAPVGDGLLMSLKIHNNKV
jgi:caffeoyl-CoA O-methyltransferase